MANLEIIDLSHTLETDMPIYPEAEPPHFERTAEIANHGFRETRLEMLTHTGTHIDCPAHLIEGGFPVDKVSLTKFYGPAMVIDCRMGKSGKIIRKSFLHQFEDTFQKVEFVLFCTGWSQLWNTPKYMENYPLLDTEGAMYLTRFNLKGVGFDTISVDPLGSEDLPIHMTFLGNGTFLIENLTNLGLLVDKPFHFSCFPLKIKDGDGSPVRAVGIVS